MSDEVNTHDNVMLQQTSRTQNIAKKIALVRDFNEHLRQRVDHQKSLTKTLAMIKEDQNELTETV